MRMQLTCAGGFLGGRHEPVESAQHPVTGGTFVKMTKSSRWLQRFITGKVHHSSLQATTVLETLTQKMLTSSDHGDGPSQVDERMLELDYDDSQSDDGTADGDDPPDSGDDGDGRASSSASLAHRLSGGKGVVFEPVPVLGRRTKFLLRPPLRL